MKDQWIDRYIADVERHLSIKNSKDILDELRSTLSDALDDRASKAGRPVDESMVLELLSEYGDPRKVAASYGQPNYLIGPDLLPIFWKVVKIVFTAISIVFLALYLLSLAMSPVSVPEAGINALEMISSLVSGLFTAFGIITLIFYLIQRSEKQNTELRGKWDPRSLPQVTPAKDAIQPASLIVGLIFSLIFLVLLNVYYDSIAIYWYSGGESVRIPFLTDSFRAFVPWLSALLAGDILLAIWLLRSGAWTVTTRVLDVLLNLGTVAVSAVILLSPRLVQPASELASALNRVIGESLRVNDILFVFALPMRIVFGLVIFFSLWDMVKGIRNLASK